VDVPPAARDPLARDLAELFVEPPAIAPDARVSVTEALIRGVQEQIRPLTDPDPRRSGRSCLDELGVNSSGFREALPQVMLRAVQQAAPAHPALQPLAAQLNADATMERIDQVLDAVQQLQVRPPAGSTSTAIQDLVAPVIDAILDVPAMADYGSRVAILNALSPQIRDAIPRHPVARVEVLNIIRTCQNYPGGLRELVSAIRVIERDSTPMASLDAAVLALGQATSDGHGSGGSGAS
jgi:hypothetical protein